ncbi:MAG: protein translocase subunit SecF [Terriglobia bacterium]
MEFFHNPNYDWMGKKWYFIGLSLTLAAIGIISIVAHGGLAYGIDFRGGTLVYLKLAQTPNYDAIRGELAREGLKDATLQRYDLTSKNEVLVGLDLRTTAAANRLDAGKQAIVKAMSALYGKGPAGKIDFNNATYQTVAEQLIVADPLNYAIQGADQAQKGYANLAQALVNYRKSPALGGLIENFSQLGAVPGVNSKVIAALENSFYLSHYVVFNTEIVGPKVGSDLRHQALYVTLAGLGAMLVYVWFRFELVYGVAAVIATFHDVIITLGIFSLLNKEISLTVIAALLTLVGYSMNDTIVVFDRIRENVHLNKREAFKDLVNRSINQTLSRTILTSGLTFLAVLSLFVFGGEVIHGFSLVLVVGVIIGTYSSFAIASPVVLYWQERTGRGIKVPERPRLAAREPAGARRSA